MKSARILIIFPLVFLIFLNKVSNGQDDIYFPLDTERAEGENCRRSDGVAGTCRRVENCQRSVRHLRDEDFCSFSGRMAIYCCPNSAPRLGTSEIPITSVDELCEAFYPRQQPHYNILITGGRKSLANQHPYMAAIGWRDFDGEIQWRCGGSVVSRKFVLTAAHCTMVRRARPDIVRTGDLNLRITENNTHPVDHDIIGIYVHPEYRANSVYHDIALLKISPNFGISPTNQPACLWSSNNIPVSELTALGYGTTEYSGPDVEILYEVEIPVLSNQACRIELPPSRSLPFGIIDGQMCALDPNGQKDTCQGDSGGPLQFSNNVGGRRRPTIVGITSFGQYCAGPSPGIYTRVSAYLNWIEPILLSDL